MCNIIIPIENTNYEFYNVPNDVAKAIVALLKECEDCGSMIVSAEKER